MTNRSSEVRIAGVLADWLNDEVRSSGIEANAYLDDYDKAVEGLKNGPGHKFNYLASKHASHVEVRLPSAWQAFNESLEKDIYEEREYQSAYLMFTPLMQVSGTYRAQCYMEAADVGDYMRRRLLRPAGVDLWQVAARRLDKWLPEPDNFGDSTITVEQLGLSLERASKIGGRVVSEVCQRAERNFDFGIEGSATARVLKSAQIEWASLAIDCITLAAKQRAGQLEAVPFLEPKSISADPPPKVIYPLAV